VNRFNWNKVTMKKPRLQLGVSPLTGLGMILVALLGAAAFPPLGLWPLALVSVALFLRLLRNSGVREALNLGLLCGIVYGLGTMYWFFGVFGILAIPLVALMGGYFGLLSGLIGMTRGQAPLVRALLVGLFAVAVEWLRGDAWYLRFPWYTVPHALAAAPALIALARWIGVYGLTYVVWLIAALGAFGRAYIWVLLLLLPLGSFLLPALDPPDRQALLIQTEDPNPPEPLMAAILTSSIDLVVLPEYAYFSSPESVISSPRGPAVLARRFSCPVVFGAIEGPYGDPKFRNVAAVLDPDGHLLGTFTKQRPVPLFLDGAPGTNRPVFPVEQGTLGVAICYDFDAPAIAASLVDSGATVLVDPTFDSLSWGRIQHLHHELLLRLRAVENDRWILRAASSGRTEAVDPHGFPSAEGVEIGKPGVTTVRFSHRQGTPLGGQAHILGPVAAGATVLVVLVMALRAWRPRRSGKASPALEVAS
jgi:apolipoprotein N-acyltransferase